MMRRAWIVLVVCAALTSATIVSTARGQHQHGSMAPAPQDGGTASSVTRWRVTMDELHRNGGVPRGWTFMLPQGDAARGRQVFADLECYKCHAIKGESFPAGAPDAKNVGPELSGMGGHHPAEYFAESILQPNRVIVQGPGFTGPDGLSVMPAFGDSLTVTQLVDLVAFLKSQTGGGDHAGHGMSGMSGMDGMGGTQREAVAGDFKVRLRYVTGHEDHMHGGGATGAHAMSKPHLMAFITDRESNEAVPYLPVTASVQSLSATTMSVKLAPMTGAGGFHYGVDVSLPEKTQKITLTIGATTMQVMDGGGRYKKPVTIAFDWSDARP